MKLTKTDEFLLKVRDTLGSPPPCFLTRDLEAGTDLKLNFSEADKFCVQAEEMAYHYQPDDQTFEHAQLVLAFDTLFSEFNLGHPSTPGAAMLMLLEPFITWDGLTVVCTADNYDLDQLGTAFEAAFGYGATFGNTTFLKAMDYLRGKADDLDKQREPGYDYDDDYDDDCCDQEESIPVQPGEVTRGNILRPDIGLVKKTGECERTECSSTVQPAISIQIEDDRVSIELSSDLILSSSPSELREKLAGVFDGSAQALLGIVS